MNSFELGSHSKHALYSNNSDGNNAPDDIFQETNVHLSASINQEALVSSSEQEAQGTPDYNSTTYSTLQACSPSSLSLPSATILPYPLFDAPRTTKELVPHPTIPPAYPIEPSTRARSTRVKKRRVFEENEEEEEERESNIPTPKSSRVHPSPSPSPFRRAHPAVFSHRPLPKRVLSNEEEFELMDFALMKKIEEMKVLREALEEQLITKESFSLKQLQFLDSIPF